MDRGSPEPSSLGPRRCFAASLPQPCYGREDGGGGEAYEPLDVHERLEVVVEHLVGEEHLHGYVDEQRGSGVDQYGEPVQQRGEQRGPEDNQRNCRCEADPHQHPADLAADPGGTDEGYDVVERHHGVGDDDDPDRLPGALPGLDLLLPLLGFVVDELPSDPDQQEPAYDLQEGYLQQKGDDTREDEPQRDGAGGTPDDRLPALVALEAAGGHGDVNGVVGGEDQVDGKYL